MRNVPWRVLREHVNRVPVLREYRLALLATASACIGCWDPPPTYDSLQQIPPFIQVGDVDPPVHSIVAVLPERTLEIHVPFRSEDLGDNVIGFARLDDSLGRSVQIAAFQLPPSTLDDLTRALDTTLDLTVAGGGCHRLTLTLTHRGNVELHVLQPSLADQVVWWLDVPFEDGSDRDPTLSECP